MATSFDYYEIGIRLHRSDMLSDPKRVSFSMSDSIYSLYNTCRMKIDDPSGLFLERLAYAKGTFISIKYGIQSRIVNTSNYVISNSYMESSTDSPGILSGPVTIELKNRWYYYQEIRSRGFRQKISDTIAEIVVPLDYIEGTDIQSTEGTDIFYQPLINDAEFIDKILTPNAYSPSANRTPFYAFITNDGVFRFKSAHKMYNDGIADELTYSPQPSFQRSNPEIILDVKYIKEKRDVERKLRNRYIYHIDADNGKLIQTEDRITDYLDREGRLLPFIADMDLKTGYVDLGKEEVTINKRNTELAQLYNTQRESMFLERLLLITPLNPRLKSGQKIQVNIGAEEKEDRGENSKTFSGQYVIENCEHIWNGDESRGYTKSLVGRKYIKTGATYPVRNRLVT